ncbi:MAG: transketolase family protein [Oscillospiraceae bacterium]|nr:transketolase family protein [Oscillospiraceae bacterium]
MGEKKATRAAYGEALVELAGKYPQMVVLDADLSQATMTKDFAAAYPERFFDCGIAEANMTVMAAGMSTCGLVPFTNTFAIFAAGRSFEQIRNSIAYPHLNVKVVGSHGGPSVGEDGATHQCNEDIALMRTLPGMTVVVPCDAHEMKLSVEAMLNYDGPCYLRMCRYAMETVTDQIPGYRFELGKGVTAREGTDLTIIATGIAVQLSLEAARLLETENIQARVIDMHTVKPLDEALVLQAAQETGAILTVEEASTVGGLGGAVAEFLSGACPVPVIRHGVPDEFGRSGTAAALLEYYGLTAVGIAEKAREVLRLKAKNKSV